MTTSTTKLAQRVCEAFASASSDLSSLFSPISLIHEHGPAHPALPFLGRDFHGHDGLSSYLTLLEQTLKVVKMEFVEFVPADDERAQDRVVYVRGQGRFEAARTGRGWEETFLYRLVFDERDLLARYEVWADPLSAYLAVTETS